jgi:DNA repair exonuclease SbcCD nuclease subunit
MFTFLHAADIHLDSAMRNIEEYEGLPTEQIRGATRHAFSKLVDYAINERVAFVVIAGDLYDGDWPDYSTGLFLCEELGRLAESGIEVFICYGNHDAQSRITKQLRLPPNTKVFSVQFSETFHLDDIPVSLHGQSYAVQDTTANLAAGYPPPAKDRFNIGVLHTAAEGREGHESYAPCSVQELKYKSYDYWALGHVHTREVSHDPWVVFPGNLQGRQIRETGPRGFMRVDVDDRFQAQIQFIASHVIRWERCDVDATDCETADDVVEHVKESARRITKANPEDLFIVRFQVKGRCPAHIHIKVNEERWRNEIRSAIIGECAEVLWAEKILFYTSSPLTPSDIEFANTAGKEMMDVISELKADPNRLEQLTGLFAPIKKILPPDLLNANEDIKFDDPQWIKDMLDRASDLLMAKLTGTNEEHK